MAITSQIRDQPSVGEIAIRRWQEAGLLKPSMFKPLIATIEPPLVRRKLGQLRADDLVSLRQIMSEILG